ncbi:hypothetical protein [uncultured Bilophila sp.]|uniref:hypothetical protein n=1 Tax=uncultured Bilophila sp. TaxID=529385 RepID=UPI0025998BA8|nr:hypothetical protein [uncultured Bilophila sp.]
MIYRNDMAVAKKTGGRGRETFYRKFPSPFPWTLIPLSSKTFDFIESLFMLFGERREVVFVKEESADLKR